MKRTLRVLAYLACGFALLLAAFHLVENWRGQRAWETWKTQRLAKGDRYDWLNLAPPEVPDADNFAKEPMVEAVVTGHGPILKAFNWGACAPKFANWRLGQREDAAAWATSYKAPSIEAALAPWKHQLDELVMASGRPKCRLPVRYEYQDIVDDSMPSLLGFRAAVRALHLRAIGRIHDGDSEGALRDTLAGLRIANHFGNEPILMSNLLSKALSGITMQSVWEGLSSHAWNENQLVTVQTQLKSMDLVASHRLTMQGERTFSQQIVDAELRKPPWARAMDESWGMNASGEVGPRISRAISHLLFLPKGWLYQNMLGTDRFYAEVYLPALDPEHHRIDLASLRRGMMAREAGGSTPYDWTGDMAVESVSWTASRTAYHQNAIDEAIIACALERYRLVHGGYPKTVNELTPTYLQKMPCDLLTGEPLHYRLEADGSFTLYSVGLDGQDDGGQVAKGKEGGVDIEHGDWAWPSR